jgi:hypothetical protein
MRMKGGCCGCFWALVGKGYHCLQLLGVAEAKISRKEPDSVLSDGRMCSALRSYWQEKLVLLPLHHTTSIT